MAIAEPEMMRSTVPRFWVEFGGSYRTDSEGWLQDPDVSSNPLLLRGTEILRTDQLSPNQSAVLLGEPGMGKSVALEDLARNRGAGGFDSAVATVNLAEFGSEERLVASFLEGSAITDWIGADYTLSLYIDSLDEARGRIPNIARLLRAYLTRWPTERLWMGIACRTADWPTSLATDLDSALADVAIYELLPLRRSDALSLAPIDVDAETFVQAIETSHAVPLASRPLTLRLLGGIYEREGGLPDRASDLYERGLTAMCDENDQSRRDSAAVQPSPLDTLATASWLAALSIFDAKSTFWRGPLADAEDSDLTVQDWARAQTYSADDAFRTGLFSGRGLLRMGWSHATFGEFLAARWIYESGLPDSQIRSILCAADETVYPQTQQVSAWLVARDPERFGWLVRNDPAAFLGNVDIPDFALRAEAVELLLERARSGELFHDWTRKYRGLGHPDLHSQLALALSDPSDEVRHIAIDIARYVDETSLVSNLAALALDETGSIRVRVAACMAIYSMPGSPSTDALTPIAISAVDSELQGAALLVSWPYAISTEAVFSFIEPRFPRNFHGLYSMFVTEFAGALTDSDFPAAMRWLTNLGDQINDSRLAPLVAAALSLAIGHLHDNNVAEWTKAFALKQAKQGQELLFSKSGSTVELTETSRRDLALALFRDCESDDVVWIANNYGGQRSSFLTADDFAWLVDKFPSAKGTFKTNIALALQLLYLPDNLGHIQVLLNLPPDHPIATDVLAQWLTPIRLDSDYALRARVQRQRLRELAEANQTGTPPDEWVNPKIDELISRARAGDSEAFWRACAFMSIPPGTDKSWGDSEPDLTQQKRWPTLSQITRDGFREASKRYLREALCRPEEWLGLNRYSEIAKAAYRALVLLRCLEPEYLDTLDSAVWREWAPILVEWRDYSNRPDDDNKVALIGKAMPYAQTELVDSLLVLIRYAGSASTDAMRHKELRLLWSPQLSAALQSDLDTLPLETQSELLDAFCELEPTSIRTLLLSRLTDDAITANREDAVDAAARLLQHDAQGGWERLAELLETDATFMADACLKRCTAYEENPPDLDDRDLTTLYLWLESNFARSEDPNFEDVHTIGPRETLSSWRDSLLDVLVRKGTESAVSAVSRIAEALPQYPWLRRTLHLAQKAQTLSEWNPLSATNLLDLATARNARLVRSMRDLVELSLASLADIQARLQGDTPDAPLLWDTTSRRPKSEDEISDYLRNHMNSYFERRGIIVNREVQARRVRPTGIGERTDIRIDATSSSNSDAEGSVLTLVGEVKGSWNRDLETALKTQLAERYMADLDATDGLYVIIWFDPADWDDTDYRRTDAARRDRETINGVLDPVIADLSQNGRRIRVIHIDASLSRPSAAS